MFYFSKVSTFITTEDLVTWSVLTCAKKAQIECFRLTHVALRYLISEAATTDATGPEPQGFVDADSTPTHTHTQG